MGVPSARAAFVLAGSAPRGPGSEACGAGPGQREKRVIPHPTCPQLTVGVCRRDEAAALVLPSLGAASPTRCGRCRPVSGFSDESCVCGSDAGPPWWALGSHGGEDPSCRCSRRFIRRASCLSSSSASHCSRCFESSEPRWPPSRPPDPSCCPALPTRRRRVWSRERARLWLLGTPPHDTGSSRSSFFSKSPVGPSSCSSVTMTRCLSILTGKAVALLSAFYVLSVLEPRVSWSRAAAPERPPGLPLLLVLTVSLPSELTM